MRTITAETMTDLIRRMVNVNAALTDAPYDVRNDAGYVFNYLLLLTASDVAVAAPVKGPYPGCRTPEKCNATGRCPRDPVCFN